MKDLLLMVWGVLLVAGASAIFWTIPLAILWVMFSVAFLETPFGDAVGAGCGLWLLGILSTCLSMLLCWVIDKRIKSKK